MDELERRLERVLAGLPDADPAVPERVARRAGELVPARLAPRRRRLVLAGALAAVVVGTGVALAGTGAIEVRVGEPREPTRTARAASRPLTLPPGAQGIAVVTGGRLHLRTRSGVGIDGLHVRTAELSPNALFVAVGLSDGLAALSPSGRRAWARPTAGPVVAVSWSPYPVWIAYVVRVGDRHQLRVIEGDGDHERLVADGVDPAQPYWSPDGSVLRFSRGGRWEDYVPSSGAPPEPGGACGEGCPAWVPAAGRALAASARTGWSVVATGHTARAPQRDAVALAGTAEGRRRLEVWWTPPRAVGAPRLLMRAAPRPGPVRISVR